MKVVTWQAPRGDTLNVCQDCQSAYERDGAWLKNDIGEEYCQVSRGLHEWLCDICDRGGDKRELEALK